MTKLDELSRLLQNDHDQLGNWRAVGSEFGITAALAYRIANEKYDPKDPVLRHKLGLPAIIPTAACVVCGKVHTLGDVCPEVTPVKLIVYEVTPEELEQIDQPVFVIVKRRKPKPDARKRERLNLPEMTDEQRRAVLSLTPEQRLAALLSAAEKEIK